MSQLLNERWSETKEALLEGLQGNRRQSMSVCLENTRKYLAESATAGATSAGNVATLNRVILPVIRRVMPTVIANEIVGVQPMTGPVGQIHTLRVRYADTSAGDGVVAGDEALSPFKIAAAYSGNNVDATPRANTTAALEGTPGKRMSIQILKAPVEAKSRKLSARWTFEAAQDAQAQQGIDIEAEIMAALAQEITAEIDQEILASLRALATVEETYDQSLVSGTATFVGDEHAALAIQINRVSNLIAQRTRRGAGNWAVVSNQALTILQSATTSAFARTTEGTFEAPTNTKFVGTLNGAMRIYVDSYLTDSGNDNNQVLIGYKGSSEADAAAFYCPYIPLMSSGVVLDPATFEPVVGFLTRYGYVELSNTASSLGNAADYLGKVAITAANVSFK
jgi:Major capsid protein Gp23